MLRLTPVIALLYSFNYQHSLVELKGEYNRIKARMFSNERSVTQAKSQQSCSLVLARSQD